MREKPDNRTAWLMSRFSEIAYLPPASIESNLLELCALEGLGFIRLKFFDDLQTDTQCYIFSFREGIGSVSCVVAFRGTETDRLTDLINDARLIQQEGPFSSSHSKVHSGFWGCIESMGMTDDFEQYLWDELLEWESRLYITGHSLGGALATMLAAALAHKLWPEPVVYTFGAPRVGNRGFAALYDYKIPKTFRYVHGTDLIPRVPWQLGRYRHCGILCYINTGLAIEVAPGLLSYYWRRYKTITRGLFKFGRTALSDHSILKYIVGTSTQEGARL